MNPEAEDNASWSNWLQGVVGGVVSKAADAQYVRPYDVQTMRLQQLGTEGYYNEGKTGNSAAKAAGMSVTTMALLGGGLLLAVFLLKD